MQQYNYGSHVSLEQRGKGSENCFTWTVKYILKQKIFILYSKKNIIFQIYSLRIIEL